MNDLWLDLRYAIRMLRRAPAFTGAAVFTLAIGIGTNTAVFSVINAALLRPLPYPEQDRLLDVGNRWEGTPRAALSPAEYFDYRGAVGDALGALGAYVVGAVNLTGSGEPARLRAGFVSADLLPVLQVVPVLGRPFTADEEIAGRSVALISHGLWQRHFGGDPDIVGRAITLDGAAHEVAGVLLPEFRLPEDYQDGLATDLLVPLGLTPADVTARGSHFLRGVGRLAPGVTRDRAETALATIAARFVRDFPDDYPRDMGFAVNVSPLAERVVGQARRPLFLLLGAAGFVLLVACANVANLLLVRLDARRAELAVRTAVGAGRTRILRQLLVESLALGLTGGAAGIALAWWGIQVPLALRPPDLPRFTEVTIDLRVLAFTAITALGTGLVFGLLPAFRASDRAISAGLQSAGRAAVRGGGGLRHLLVMGQVALALVLLAGAGLLGRSLVALYGVDPGYRVDQVLTGRLSLPTADYPEERQVVDLFAAVRERVAALPGVRAAGGVSNLPLAGGLGDLNIEIEGREKAEGEVSPRGDWQVVSPGYFDAMGLRLRRGRFLDERDRTDAPGAVVINETMAARYWPGQDPLGTRFKLGAGAGPGWVTVVGIVADVRHGSLTDAPASQMYLSHAQFRFWNGGSVVRALTLAVRASGDPAALAGAVRQALRAVDPRVPLASVRTMREVRATSLGRERFLFALAAVFAVVALTLGTLGIYGVLAYGVARRTREIGLRLALGARTADVARLVIREGGAMTGMGLAVGLLGALALGRLLRGLLFDVAPLDPFTLVAAPLLLAAAALLASWLPARRAARIAPMEALRHE